MEAEMCYNGTNFMVGIHEQINKKDTYVSRWQFNFAYWLYQINMMQVYFDQST